MTGTAGAIRPARTDEIEALDAIWHEAWHDAHAAIVPAGLTAARTLQDFRARLERLQPTGDLLIAEHPIGGFVVTKDDELNQLMVARDARGQGVAQTLMAAATDRIRGAGHDRAWLHCASGNTRARGFYERLGWIVAREEIVDLKTPNDSFAVPCWRMDIAL